MSWDPILTPVDYVLLGGEVTPGLTHLEGAGSPRNWDKVRGYGMSGFYPRFTGDGLAEFAIVIRLVTAQHWVDWESFAPFVRKPPLGKSPRALDIAHPFLDALEIYAVVIVDATQPAVDDDGIGTVRISVLQHRRPKPQYAKPDSSGDSKPAPKDKREQVIENLVNQIEALAPQ